jgi:hypothetical protein
MKKQQLTKEQFRTLLREMIIVEFSIAAEKERQRQSKLANIPGTFSHWMTKAGKLISQTGGDFKKIIDALTAARIEGDISHMSDDKYSKLVNDLKRAPNDMKRLYCLYNYDLKGRGLGSPEPRRYR